MGIDGIGKRGTGPTGISPGDPSAVGKGDRSDGPQAGDKVAPFQVEPSGGGPRVAAPGVDATKATALQRLRAGELDVDGYVEQKVQEATAHLATLPTAELDAIRRALRHQVETDPGLADLVRGVAGRDPTPRDE